MLEAKRKEETLPAVSRARSSYIGGPEWPSHLVGSDPSQCQRLDPREHWALMPYMMQRAHGTAGFVNLPVRNSDFISGSYFTTTESSPIAFGVARPAPSLDDFISTYIEFQTPRLIDLKTRLFADVEFYDIEPFNAHPAELPAQQMFFYHEKGAMKWSMELDLEGKITPSIITILGRIKPGSAEWRAAAIQRWLESPSVQTRDAAVGAAETWNEPESIAILRDHKEDRPWLSKYIEDILQNF